MTIYRVKGEYADSWTNEDIYPVYVTREQIEDMARGWGVSVEDLMEQVEEVDEDEALDDVIARTADRIFCGLEAALTEGATIEEEDRTHDLLHEGFDPADSYASVYIVPFLRDIAKDNGMTAEAFEVDEEAVIDHFADQVRDLLEEEESTEGNTVRYFLDFDPFDQDAFCLMTTDGHETVCEGRLSEIVEPGDDWQDALDQHFEKTLGILPNEWEIG